MRLTLRTLLAYMDGILEPEDARDIGKKIEDSELATNLLNRTRVVVRRLRLAAPSFTDQGSGLDANTVAEYLDNTLHDDRVPDFEKVCLESDVHLAEVASCHQILTLVLGEPAEIDPTSRQRMYQLPDEETAAVKPPSVAPPVAVPLAETEPRATASAAQVRQKPTVPDYLRESRRGRRFLPIAASLVVAVCLAAVVLLLMGQFKPGTPLGNLFGVQSDDTQVAQGSDENSKSRESGNGDDDSAAKQGTQPADGATPPSPDDQPPTDDQSAGDDDSRDPPDEDPSKVIVPPDPVEPPAPADGGDNGDTPGDPPLPSENPPAPPAEPLQNPGDIGPETPDPNPPEDPPPAPVPPQQMGSLWSDDLMSDDQVLLKYGPEGTGWARVPANGPLFPLHRLVALPTYRTKVTLFAGVNLQLLGGTEVTLLPADQQQPAGLAVRYGQVRIMPSREAGTQVRLVLGNRTGVITFADAHSVVALQVIPAHSPGKNPEEVARALTADLCVLAGNSAPSGHVLWSEAGMQEPLRIGSGNRLILHDQAGRSVARIDSLPKWISTDTISFLDRQASSLISRTLRTDQPADLGLMELADDRRKEVRWLAERCLAYIGHYDSMAAALNNPEYKLDWPEYVEELQRSAGRSVETARGVRLAFEKRLPQEAPILYEMLWGYTLEDLRGTDGQDGKAAELVEYLDHDTLAVRVVSFWNLKKITGWGLSYKPEQTAAKRRLPIREWGKRLASGEILAKLVAEPQEVTTPQKAPLPEGPEQPL